MWRESRLAIRRPIGVRIHRIPRVAIHMVNGNQIIVHKFQRKQFVVIVPILIHFFVAERRVPAV